MSTHEKLLPCPFCGGEVQFRKALLPSDGNTDAIIHAAPSECGLSHFDIGTTDESVIAAWNRRTMGGSGWQPISTAPKDGTRFWGKVGDDAIAMLWHDKFNAFVSSWRCMQMAPGYQMTEHHHSPTIEYPTHWMPLPAAPTEGSDE